MTKQQLLGTVCDGDIPMNLRQDALALLVLMGCEDNFF